MPRFRLRQCAPARLGRGHPNGYRTFYVTLKAYLAWREQCEGASGLANVWQPTRSPKQAGERAWANLLDVAYDRDRSFDPGEKQERWFCTAYTGPDTEISYYGETPMVAICRTLVAQRYGESVTDAVLSTLSPFLEVT